MSGGKGSTRGTPQGGVVSPLLANIYMNRFLKHWRLSGRGKAFRAQVVAYADDFVILSRGFAAEALAWTKAVMTKLGLSINEAIHPGASPSKKSVHRLKTKVGDLLTPRDKAPWPNVCKRLNRLLSGWEVYFSYGLRSVAYQAVDRYVCDRVRRFLAKRHKMQNPGARTLAATFVCNTSLTKQSKLTKQ